MKDIDIIKNKILSEFKNYSYCLGVMHCGSTVSGAIEKNADIDFFVLVREGVGYTRLHKIVGSVKVDIILDTEEEMLRYMREDMFTIKRSTAHMLSWGNILFDTKEKLKKVQEEARASLEQPVKYTPGEILMHKYSIDDFLDDMERACEAGDVIGFAWQQNLLLQNVNDIIFKLEGKVMPKVLTSESFLAIDISLCERIKGSLSGLNLLEKFQSSKTLVQYVYKKYGGPLPAEWKA